MRLLIAAYVLGAVVTSQVVAGWILADSQDNRSGGYPALGISAREDCYEQAGFAQALGLIAAIGWPTGAFTGYLVTGFAQHGWLPPTHCASLLERVER